MCRVNLRSWVSLMVLCSYYWVAVHPNTDAADLAALRSLKRQWQNTPPNWKRDPCGRKWEGIGCSNSSVTSIILSGTNLAGSLPDDILSLSQLETLDLSNNKGLRGPLPLKIGSLKNLVNLTFHHCSFSGSIPWSIGSLLKLNSLFLSSNNFTGPIPASIGYLTKLVWLDLSHNELDGPIPVSNTTSPGLDMLLNAKHFHLGRNKFSGEIPPELFSLNMSLKHLILNNNKLDGRIPHTLGLVQTMRVIRLDGNSLTGPVPTNLGTLTSVTQLLLSDNNLTDQIPDLTRMNLLTYVDMSNNRFDRSSVPQWFKTLPNLTTLKMKNIGLEGPIPAEVFNLPRLETLILSNNHLNGTVNMDASFSSDLRLIDLRNNSIEEFTSGLYQFKALLDDNLFCVNPEAPRICKTVQPETQPFSPNSANCAPLSCFRALVGSSCTRPYLGSMIFRSVNFSDITNLVYYDFLRDSLQPFAAHVNVPVDRVCLVNSMIGDFDYLVLYIAFFPLGRANFNRTEISMIGHILNNHDFTTPYGAYYFIDITYTSFAGPGKNIALIIGVTVCWAFLAVLVIAAGVYAYHQRKIANRATANNNLFSSWNDGNLTQLKRPRLFSFAEVKKFADNFSERSEIGSGGYGKVHKGRSHTGQQIAIKRATRGSLQGAVEFKTEIELLSRVHHRNVVNLVGYCNDKGEQMLIYEYVPNGSLRETLSGKSGIQLNWARRLNVALGVASGLAYLHELADPPIIHRDMKSDNILLDDQLIAKVADFGICKALDDDKDHFTTQVKGTMGYLDPEYYMTQMLTTKSDVYSFGVVMLELVTGKKALENSVYIVREVMEALKVSGNLYKLVDSTILSDTVCGLKEFVDLAMRCVQDTGDERPSMSEVVSEIENIIQEGNLGNSTSMSSTSYEGAGNGVNPYSSSRDTSFSYYRNRS